MRFELTVALKYLIPRWRQLSVSIISFLSVVVISLVVWLVVLFLSVTEGIEKRWIDELVSFSAPLKLVPTEEYYRSYYYQIDSYSANSNYSVKTIGEKLAAPQSDPYDPAFDAELSGQFPAPDLYPDGSLKDPVKEAWSAILSLSKNGSVRPQEYEVSFGNLRLNILREDHDTYLTQVCYVSSLDKENKRMQSMLLPSTSLDYQNLLQSIGTFEGSSPDWKNNLASFFRQLDVCMLQTPSGGYFLPKSLFPLKGEACAIAIFKEESINKIFLPQSEKSVVDYLPALEKQGYHAKRLKVRFADGEAYLSENEEKIKVPLVLEEKVPFHSKLIADSLDKAKSHHDLFFSVEAKVQNITLKGIVPLKGLEIAEIVTSRKLEANPSFWVHEKEGSLEIPRNPLLGEGILIAKHFQHNGARLGDRGYLAYYSPTASSVQEQRIPVYVAGFYDPGILPLGNRLIFADANVTSLLRNELAAADSMLGNGIHVWLSKISDVGQVKEQLIQALKEKGIENYWKVESYEDYEFSRPLLQQLKSDKNLFTLIAIIILIVACSNVISMLILLVNDKKKEIGILQSMGASPSRIAFIFGFCGFTLGLISCIIGIAAAFLTLNHLQSLVDFLSVLQGHEVFQKAFYGHQLPNEISLHALLFVTAATLLISLAAGIIPAIKAAKIRPSEILRSE